MRRIMMKSKIHRATVVGADLNYVGSITLDPEMLDPGMLDPASLSAHEAATTNADPRSRRRSVRFTTLDAPGAVP